VQIAQLEEQVSCLQRDTRSITEENMSLQREVAEKHCSLQHSEARIMALEESEASLKDRVSLIKIYRPATFSVSLQFLNPMQFQHGMAGVTF
jgi:hypothetical protein